MPLDLPPAAKLWLPPKPAIIRSWSKEDIKLLTPVRDNKILLAGLVPAVAINRPLTGGPTVTLTDSETQISTGVLYTFTTKAAGTAFGTSRVICLVHGWVVTAGADIRTGAITFNGGATTGDSISTSGTVGNIGATAAIANAAVAGTTVTIVVPWVTAMDACRVDIYRVNSLTSGTHDFGHTTGGGSNVGNCEITITSIVSPGIIMACFTGNYTGGAAPSGFSNLLGSTDSQYTNSGNLWSLAAHSVSQPSTLSRIINCAFPNTGTGAMAIATWH